MSLSRPRSAARSRRCLTRRRLLRHGAGFGAGLAGVGLFGPGFRAGAPALAQAGRPASPTVCRAATSAPAAAWCRRAAIAAPTAPTTRPSAGLQFFGQVRIDGESEAMTVTLKDVENRALYSVTLEAAEAT